MGVIEVAGQLDHGNVQHLASGKRPKFKIDTENEKMSYYCALCDVSCDCQNDFEKHLAWVKHKEKINVEKEKHTYKSWGNLDGTEMKKVIYCCDLCKVSCGYQNGYLKHLAGRKHKEKVNKEEEKQAYKSCANTEKERITYPCFLCQALCLGQTD